MLEDIAQAVEILVIASLVVAQVFDIYCVMVRAQVNRLGATEILAVANWIQYLARILNMVSVFSISILLERKVSSIGVPDLFGYSMIAGLLLMLLMCRYALMGKVTQFLQVLGFAYVFGKSGKINYWWRVTWAWKPGVTLFSAVIALLINLAIIMPFALSSWFPEMRMTLAYTGQLLNFCASIITFTYVDKVFFRALDKGSEFECASAIVIGKLLAQALLVSLFCIYFFEW
ncbi:hypothetical protein [Pseudomonas sp. NPDC007930]|uniref:hypothetical protein n=1 Tax=Pseudomonas sp. NPDC007930 TaxID=3364417 RepID=UPI0036EE8C2F